MKWWRTVATPSTDTFAMQFFNILDYFDMTPSEVFDDENMDTLELRETIHLLCTLSDEDVRLVLGVVRRIKVLSDSGAGSHAGKDAQTCESI